MSFFRKASLSVLALTALAVSTPQLAKAEGFALQDWSARGAALAGGLIARGGDASVVSYNPAAITELEGTQVMVGGELINLTNTIRNINAPNTTAEQKWFIAPHGYITHKLNDKVSLGLGLYSRYGLGLDYGASWPGSTALQQVELMTFSATPVLAYQVTDQLSLAVALEIMGGTCELYNGQGSYGSLMGLEGDAVGYGYHLAAHYKFNEQWKAGFVYRSHITLDFDGDISGMASQPIAIPGVFVSPNLGTTGSAKIYTPDTFALALAYFPTDNLSFEAQVQYNTWSRFHSLTIEGDNGNEYYMPKDWDDTWFFSLSAEYGWNEWLTLRAGVSYETGAVNLAHADYMVPADGRWKYGVGFGIEKNNWTVDVSYVFHDVHSLKYGQSDASNGVVHAVSSETKQSYANTIGISIGYKF